MTDFEIAHLFGKAISTELPIGFVDASGIRQVPDHQEVFLDRDGFTSIIFELNERVAKDDNGKTLDDNQALLYHFNDIVSGTNEDTHVQSLDSIMIPNLPDTPVRRLMATQKMCLMAHQQNESPAFTTILLMLIRLVEKNADVLITINIPHSSKQVTVEDGHHSERNPESLTMAGFLYQNHIIESFRINDWSLFG